MITLRCDGCKDTTCYYVVTTSVFETSNFKNMLCPVTGFPTEWVDVAEEEQEE